MPRFRRIRRGTRRLRPVEWLGVSAESQLIDITPTIFGLSVDLTAITDLIANYTQPTLMRIRGSLLATRQSDNDVIGAVGIISQIPNQSTLVPATLNPLFNPEFEWIWWHVINLSNDAGNDASYHRIDIDSKAMRKLNNGEQLYLWAASADTDQTFNLQFGLRYLLKE